MTGQRGSSASWVLGVDSGGSGLRIALAPTAAPGTAQAVPRPAGTISCSQPVRTVATGIDPEHLLEQLLPAARTLLAGAAPGGPGRISAVCVGSAGMATLGDGLRAVLPDALASAFGVRHLALAADAVTAYAGALGEIPGAVVAGGTGMIALGTDLRSWQRADGWGHLLGDAGGGAWIGRAGLEAALRAHDGRRGGSAALLARAEALLGPPAGIPGQLYPRSDRPAVLASFAPEVARCAASDPADPVALGILQEAAHQIATTAAAVCPTTEGSALALTGGLFQLGETLLAPLRAELSGRLPLARLERATGRPLDGALLIAARLASDTLRLPSHPTLLHLS